MLSGAKSVVEDELGFAVAIGVEAAADVGKGIPLRRVLQGEQDEVVGNDVGQPGHVGIQRVAEVLLLAAQRRGDARRLATRVEDAAAGIVERQREAERAPLLHLGDALQDLFLRDPVHAATLVIRAEVAPVRARRPVLPSLRHQ
jgi:hypothetical protein